MQHEKVIKYLQHLKTYRSRFEAGQLGADTQYGHVAFVEKVNADGSIIISESNVKGLGVISYRTIDADDAAQLDYITGK